MASSPLMARVPRYLTQFQCIGPQCEETCCSGWQVPIDKPTWLKYRQVRVQPLAGELQAQVLRNPTGSAAEHARIQLRANGDCPFLDAARLCSIQSQLGADHLSDTCNHYPRAYQREAGRLSACASLSCPQAARLALLDPQALDPVDMALAFSDAARVPFGVDLGAAPLSGADPVQFHAALIREALGVILRYPGLSAAHALLVCGIVVRRLVAAVRGAADAAQAAQAPVVVLGSFMTPQALDQAGQLILKLQTPEGARMALLQEISARYVSEVGGRLSFRQCIAEAMEGFGHGQTDLAGMQARHDVAEREVFAPFEAAHPYLLRNYLLNDLAKSLLPAGGVDSLEGELFHLSVRFALIRLYLVGLAARHGAAFDTGQCVRTVYTFARNIEHNPNFMPGVMKLMAEHGYANLATVATLLR